MQIEFGTKPRLQDQAIGGAAEMEHAQLLSLAHVLPGLHGDLAASDFAHPDGGEAEHVDIGVVFLN